jgi:hypothetical protein
VDGSDWVEFAIKSLQANRPSVMNIWVILIHRLLPFLPPYAIPKLSLSQSSLPAMPSENMPMPDQQQKTTVAKEA